TSTASGCVANSSRVPSTSRNSATRAGSGTGGAGSACATSVVSELSGIICISRGHARAGPLPDNTSVAARACIAADGGGTCRGSRRQRAVVAQQATLQEPGACVFGIALEPGTRGAEAEAVAPGVHVPHQTRGADAGQGVGEQDLQVAGRIFL